MNGFRENPGSEGHKKLLKYSSLCSGISCESVAWKPLGFEPVWFAQHDPKHNYENGPDFPSAVLANQYPNTPNLGDITRLNGEELKTKQIDILVGGTPCQSFSILGNGEGLNDERGQLALTFVGIAGILKPKWVVWENVPEVLSCNGGEDFATILSALAKVGYCCSWQLLDAGSFGLPVSRERLFLVGHSDWRRAAAIFAERGGLRTTDPANRRRAPRGGKANSREANEAAYAIASNLIQRSDDAGPRGKGIRAEQMYCLTTADRHAVIANGVARYLTPTEWERLQGLPDDYTKIAANGNPASECSYDRRYKAIGNGMAVPVLKWLGERIQLIDSLADSDLPPHLHPNDLAHCLSDSEIIAKCEQGFTKLKELVPYLREARERFAQPGRRVPVEGKPTWTEWIERNLKVTRQHINRLLRDADTAETEESGTKRSKKQPRNKMFQGADEGSVDPFELSLGADRTVFLADQSTKFVNLFLGLQEFHAKSFKERMEIGLELAKRIHAMREPAEPPRPQEVQ